MPTHVWRGDGREFNADGRVLLDWAVLSTALCLEAAEWTRTGDGDHSRVHSLYLFLMRFFDDEQLQPASMFDYERLVREHLRSRTWDSSADRRHLDEIRRAAPVVGAFRGLLSADSGSEYASDREALGRRTAAWADATAVENATTVPGPEPAPPCELCAVMSTSLQLPVGLAEVDCVSSFDPHDMYFSARVVHCEQCGRAWLMGYYEVDLEVDPQAEWGERHFVWVELSTVDLYRIAASSGQRSLDLTKFEERKGVPAQTATDAGPTPLEPTAVRGASRSKNNPITIDPNDPRNAVETPMSDFRATVLLTRGILTVDDILTMIENGDVIVPVAEPYVQPETWDEIAEQAEGGTPFGHLGDLDPEGRLRAAYLKKVVENGLAAAAADRAAAGEAPVEETVEGD